MTTTGLDVSVFNQPTPSLDGLGFLIARACYGTLYDDWYWATEPNTNRRYVVRGDGHVYQAHIAAAKAAGLVTGAYCFGRTVEDPEAQAHMLLATAGDVDFLVLDVEMDNAQPEMTEAQCRAFLAYCKANDPRQVWLYHSTDGYPADAYGFDGRWVADYGPNDGAAHRPPPIPWELWQYTSKPVDTNQYQGTADDLRARLGSAAVTYFTIETSTTGELVDLPINASVFDVAKVDIAHQRRKLQSPETWLTVGWVVGEDGNRFMCRVGGDGVFEFVLASEIGKPYDPAAGDCSALIYDARIAEYNRVTQGTSAKSLLTFPDPPTSTK